MIDLSKYEKLRTICEDPERNTDAAKGRWAEERARIQTAIRRGETTGDHFNDYAIMRYGGIEDKFTKPFRDLDGQVQAHQGQLVLMIERWYDMSAEPLGGEKYIMSPPRLEGISHKLGIISGPLFLHTSSTSLQGPFWEIPTAGRHVEGGELVATNICPRDWQKSDLTGIVGNGPEFIFGTHEVEKWFKASLLNDQYASWVEKLNPPQGAIPFVDRLRTAKEQAVIWRQSYEKAQLHIRAREYELAFNPHSSHVLGGEIPKDLLDERAHCRERLRQALVSLKELGYSNDLVREWEKEYVELAKKAS